MTAPNEKKPDRIAVALPLTRFMRAAWQNGFASGLVTVLSATGLPDDEINARADSMMKRMDADPAAMAMVTKEVDELVMTLLTQDGAVSTMTSEGPQAGSEEAELLSEAVRSLMLNEENR